MPAVHDKHYIRLKHLSLIWHCDLLRDKYINHTPRSSANRNKSGMIEENNGKLVAPHMLIRDMASLGKFFRRKEEACVDPARRSQHSSGILPEHKEPAIVPSVRYSSWINPARRSQHSSGRSSQTRGIHWQSCLLSAVPLR